MTIYNTIRFISGCTLCRQKTVNPIEDLSMK